MNHHQHTNSAVSNTHYYSNSQSLGFNTYNTNTYNSNNGFIYNNNNNNNNNNNMQAMNIPTNMNMQMNMNVPMNMNMPLNMNINPMNTMNNMSNINNYTNNNNINNNFINNANNHANNNDSQPNGGVASVLDYDLDQMVKFLSWVTFGLVKKSMNPSLNFQKSINSVLAATRLPKSTLLLAINYLSNKMDDDYTFSYNYNEDEIFKILITALILANKFNDDKTFRNKSWSDATSLPLLEINKLERFWLMDCNYELFKTNSFAMVESCWNTWCIKNIQSLDANQNYLDLDLLSSNTNAATPIIQTPLTPISIQTDASSPLNPSSCCYYDNNIIPNQIFENPFQNLGAPVSAPVAVPLPPLISPINDVHYLNDYYDHVNNNSIPQTGYYNNTNNIQTHHLDYDNESLLNYADSSMNTLHSMPMQMSLSNPYNNNNNNNNYHYNGFDYNNNYNNNNAGYQPYGAFNAYNYCTAAY